MAHPILVAEQKTTEGLLVPSLFQDRPPGSMHYRDPESNPDYRKENHARPSARHIKHILAGDQRQKKDQNPAPEWNPVEFSGLLFMRLRRGLLILVWVRCFLFLPFLAFRHWFVLTL